MKTMKVLVVSQEAMIYQGEAAALFAKGTQGDLGIYPGHLQLLTSLVPGLLRIKKADQEEMMLYISGGILEVQPNEVSILADTILRPQDLNEAAALEAKRQAEEILSSEQQPLSREAAQAKLAEALAKLHIVELLREKQTPRH